MIIAMTKLDVIIDKTVVLVWGLCHTLFKINIVCSFLHKITKVRSSTCTVTMQNMLQQGKQTNKLNLHTNRLICITLYAICLTFTLFRFDKCYHRETLSRPIPPCTKTPSILFCGIRKCHCGYCPLSDNISVQTTKGPL